MPRFAVLCAISVAAILNLTCAASQAPSSQPSPSAEYASNAQAPSGEVMAASEAPASLASSASSADMEYAPSPSSPAPVVAPAPTPAPPPPADMKMAEADAAAPPPMASMAAPKASKSAGPPSAPPPMAGAGAGMGKAAGDKKSGVASTPGVATKPEPKPEPKKPEPQVKTPAPKREKTVKYLSADDSNSMASPVITRQTIRNGRYVQPLGVRTYEFLNYARFDYPPAKAGTIAIYPQMRPTDKAGEMSLQVAVRSEDRSLKDLSPMNITVVFDVSGSMAGRPFDIAKAFLKGFVQKLRAGDVLSIVAVNRDATVLLDSHAVGDGTLAKIDELLVKAHASDVTNLTKGVVKGYELAQKNYKSGRVNRVILISDGADNAGGDAVSVISKAAQDSDKQGIYLAGIGVGEGFNDYLMDAFTDKGRGAYVFLDTVDEVAHVLQDRSFVASFDLADKDIRLKMVMPEGFYMTEFHGEAISSVKEDIVPQYLAPNSQMIYHLVVKSDDKLDDAKKAEFEFEAEYTPLGGKPQKAGAKVAVADMLKGNKAILKGDAVVAYAEMLKKIKRPLADNKDANLKEVESATAKVKAAKDELNDPELAEIMGLLEKYARTVKYGEELVGARDDKSDDIDAALGLSPNTVTKAEVGGVAPAQAVKVLSQLGSSTYLVPQEGYKFVAVSSGPIWNPSPAGGGGLGGGTVTDPTPDYLGHTKTRKDGRPVYDHNWVKLKLKAPKNAKSFSFDFNFFSAEYPGYVKQNFNDAFYAVLEAATTNGGDSTNISFDANNNTVEVDNNYFQQPFHPTPNWGTGFDAHGSTGWLRTSWPIKGGEELTLTFSVHDEGDAVYDSLVLLDNFQWHDFDAVGTTDPLN